MNDPVVIFVFAGRQQNIALQLPLIEHILATHPNVQYDIWNLSQTPEDDAYLRQLSGPRITVRSELYGRPHWEAFNKVYEHYAHPSYHGHWFVKLDEDVVFLEAARFGEFLDALTPYRVLSADVINNGACVAQDLRQWKLFTDLYSTPLLDIHKSPEFWAVAHSYAQRYWSELIDQRLVATPVVDWLSINMIGYGWDTAVNLSQRIGTDSPNTIAGRDVSAWPTLGAEGVINTMSRSILRGFRAVHLYFGPQRDQLACERVDTVRDRYAELGHEYLLEHR